MTEAENQIMGAHEAAIGRLKQIRETIVAMREQERQAYLHVKDCEAAGRLFGIAFPPIDRPIKPSGTISNVREFAIWHLLNSPDGIKSQTIGAAYKEAFGRELHPKTIGMTLYRLKQDGLAEREGRVWHSVDGSNPR